MGPADSLMLDAKQAILDEQHRKFQVLQKEGRWPEAMQQFHVTLRCASDVLTESLQLLDDADDDLAESRRVREDMDALRAG